MRSPICDLSMYLATIPRIDWFPIFHREREREEWKTKKRFLKLHFSLFDNIILLGPTISAWTWHGISPKNWKENRAFYGLATSNTNSIILLWFLYVDKVSFFLESCFTFFFFFWEKVALLICDKHKQFQMV